MWLSCSVSQYSAFGLAQRHRAPLRAVYYNQIPSVTSAFYVAVTAVVAREIFHTAGL